MTPFDVISTRHNFFFTLGYLFDHDVATRSNEGRRLLREDDDGVELWVAGRTNAFPGEELDPEDVEEEGVRCVIVTVANNTGIPYTVLLSPLRR